MVQFLFYISWEQRKLGEMVNEVTRTDPESNAPIMMITANNGFIEQSDRYAFDNAGESLKKYILLEKGELAYNHGASKLRPYGSCFALTTVEKARIPFVYHCFSAKNQNSEFLSIELNSDNVEKQLRRIVSSGARMDGLLNISFTEYSTVELSLPKTEEQDKISYCFRMFDNLITLHQCKHFILFNNFLSHLVSFGKCKKTNSWEQRKLGEVTKINMGQSPAGVNYTANPNDAILVQGNADMVDGWVCPRVYTRQITKKAHVGDLIFSVRAPVGEVGKTQYDVVIGRGVAAISGNEYIFQTLKQMNAFGYWTKLSAGSTFESINSDTLKSAKLFVPKENEQRKIGEILLKIDNLITLHQRKLKDFYGGFL